MKRIFWILTRTCSLVAIAGLAAPAVAYDNADLVPSGLGFVNRAAAHHDIAEPASQYAVLTVRNIGNLTVGRGPDASGGGLSLPNSITVLVKGYSVTTYVAAVPAKTQSNINLSLPAGLLHDCERVEVYIDTARTAGQWGGGPIFANDRATLVAREFGSTKICAAGGALPHRPTPSRPGPWGSEF